MEKLVWASVCVNHSRHMAGPAATALWVHTRAHEERGLSPCLEAGQPAAGCPALNHRARERPENEVGIGRRTIQQGLLSSLSWCHDAGLDVFLLIPESVSDVSESHRISSLSLKPAGPWFIL